MILSMGASEIPAVMDLCRKFMYGIIARSYKFRDVHLLCSLICITSCCLLDADWGKCISRKFVQSARRILFIIIKINLFVNTIVR